MKKLLLALSALCLPAAAFAQTSAVPVMISYSGKVVDASGVPVGSASAVNRTVTFRIWNHPSATAAANRLWSEAQSVTITGGEFSVLVGSGTAVPGEPNAATNFADVFDGTLRYLGVTVDDGTAAADPEMSPRQQIVTSPFAFRAKVAEAVASGGVSSTALANNAVNTLQIADAAVATSKLADGSVQGAKIADGAIGATKIADGSITAAKFAAGALDGGSLANLSVTAGKLAANSVDSSKIADGAVVLADLAASSVDSGKIVDGSVALADLAANSVDGAKIVDGSIGTNDLGASVVTGAKIANLAVTTTHLVNNAIDGTKLAAGAVGVSHLNASAKDTLSKGRVIYNQCVSPDYAAQEPIGAQLVPIDIGDLGNDADGCLIKVIAQHRTVVGDFRWSDITITPTQPGFTNDSNYPNIVVCGVRTVRQGSDYWGWFKLNTGTIAAQGIKFSESETGWFQFFNYYPGSLAPGLPSPFNIDQEPNASNGDAGGGPQKLKIVSVQVGTNASNGSTLIITVDSGHAIQVGDVVTIAGLTGSGSPNGNRTVTVVNDRMSFTIDLTGAGGSYSGPGTSACTITYKPKYDRWRIWLVVHPNVSARVIVYDR